MRFPKSFVGLIIAFAFLCGGAKGNDQVGSTQFLIFEPGTLVEMYNAKINHYFYVEQTDPERTAILSGAAGQGWSETGAQFQGFALASVTPLLYTFCRFYGSQFPGPNSHFFTLDSKECDHLKALQKQTPNSERRWNFEGTVRFLIAEYSAAEDLPQNANRGCKLNDTHVSAISRVIRFYNNGFSKGVDSNHRFVAETDAGTISKMNDTGWKNEGIVFCALASTNAR